LPGRDTGGRGTRGKIYSFTGQARLRLLKKVMQIERKYEPIMLTLTYPGEWKQYDYKENLRVFKERFKRKYPQGSFLWKLEYQKRGAPHFHLLLFNVNYKSVMLWAKKAWYETVKSGDIRHFRAGTRVEIAKNRSKMISYMCKYVTKVETDKIKELIDAGIIGEHGLGRFWGKCGDIELILDKGLTMRLPVGIAYDLKRIFRRMAGTKKQIGSVFLNDPGKLCELIYLIANNRGIEYDISYV